MTATLSYFRAAEIIAAYGGDPARWPDAERVMTRDVVAANPALATAVAEARTFDADLAAWARSVVPVDPAKLVAAGQTARPQPVLRWAVGAAIAASLAGLLTVAPLRPDRAHPGVVIATGTDEATAFAQIFTPTPDEEQFL